METFIFMDAPSPEAVTVDNFMGMHNKIGGTPGLSSFFSLAVYQYKDGLAGRMLLAVKEDWSHGNG